MLPPAPAKQSHTDLIVFGGLSIWMNMFGLGFFALRAVKHRLRSLPPDADGKEFQQLLTAYRLSQVSIVLFAISWLGLFVMAAGHGREYRKQHPMEQKR